MNELHANHIRTLSKRRDYLTGRIAIKQAMDPPWDTQWDIGERDATAWALEVISRAARDLLNVSPLL